MAERREELIRVRLSGIELARFRSVAEEMGLPVSEMLRQLVRQRLGRRLREVDEEYERRNA